MRPLSLLALLCAAPLAAQDADLDRILRYAEGRFDNHLQVWQQAEDGVADSLRHPHVHAVLAPVDVPAVGPHVVRVQQRLAGAPDGTGRQRLYSFAPGRGADAGRIVMTVHPVRGGAVPDDGAPPDTARLAAREPEALQPGCQVVWTREGDAFRGQARGAACGTGSSSGRAGDGLYLDGGELWMGAGEAGHVAGAHGPYRLRRADAFAGWAVLRADGSEGTGPAPDSAFVAVRDLVLHDEGQRQRLVAADGRDLGVTVELAQLVYQASQTAVLTLALYRDGESRAFAYTWADPDARRIGLNLRWVQVGLTRQDGR